MDVSSTYIKMCEKAEEIQDKRFDCGDYIAKPGYRWESNEEDADTAKKIRFHQIDIMPSSVEYFYISTASFANKSNIWLPRQDQLQEMVIKTNEEPPDLLLRFCDWFRDSMGVGADIFIESWCEMPMEQLWLTFVMQEKYGKIWNGNDWING